MSSLVYSTDKMKFNEMLKNNEYTIYALSKKSGIAKTTLFDISSGKSNIFDCSGRILLKLSKSLNITIEELLNLEYEEYNPAFEEMVPEFLKEGIILVKKGRKKNDLLLDCYLDELNSSINVCEVESLISKEQADYLRNKFLWR